MSFYGNVFQELTNAFASFIIQSKYNDVNSKTTMEAIGTGGKFTFAPGNEWIELGANTNDYVCSIKHASVNADRIGTQVIPFAVATAADTGTTTALTAGTTIKVPKFKYDQAGHIITSEDYDLYKLPINETESNIEDLRDRMTVLEEAETRQDQTIQELGTTVNSYDGNISSTQIQAFQTNSIKTSDLFFFKETKRPANWKGGLPFCFPHRFLFPVLPTLVPRIWGFQ